MINSEKGQGKPQMGKENPRTDPWLQAGGKQSMVFQKALERPENRFIESIKNMVYLWG